MLSYQDNQIFSFLASSLFIMASITDFLDGFLARKFLVESKLGSYLDLLADKLLICCLLLWLTFSIKTPEILVLSLILLSREISISSMRQWALNESKDNFLKPNSFGKVKTLFQMLSVSILLLRDIYIFSIDLYQVGILFLTLATLLSILSFFIYLRESLLKL